MSTVLVQVFGVKKKTEILTHEDLQNTFAKFNSVSLNPMFPINFNQAVKVTPHSPATAKVTQCHSS